MKKKLVIGTRGSKLAIWQAEFIASLLHQQGLETVLQPIKTAGDKILEVSIAKIGSKGVFTEAIEEELRNGNIDIAVHSAKDLQSDLGPNFELIAFTEKIYPNDAIISCQQKFNLHHPSKLLKMGTSSTRRTALLKRYFPYIKPVDIRGNLHTRIRKMAHGHCDALLVALSGVQRMQLTDRLVHVLPTHQFVPAVGQGSIAVEAAKHLDVHKKALIRQYVNHAETEVNIIAERAFLKTLEGGCSIPAFAMATTQAHQLRIEGGVISLDGKQLIQEVLVGNRNDPIALGIRLAQLILQQGGEAIIKSIKKNR